MELKRRNMFVYGLLLAVWLLVVIWQMEEHDRAKDVAKAGLRNRSRDVASMVSALIRGSQFRGAVFQERLEPILWELVNSRTNEVIKPSEVIWVALLNADEELLASAGEPTVDPQKDVVPEGGLWLRKSMTMEHPVAGILRSSEGTTNQNQTPTVVPPPPRDLTNAVPESMRGRGPRREPRPDDPERRPDGGPRPEGRGGDFRPPPPDTTNAPGRMTGRDGENRPPR